MVKAKRLPTIKQKKAFERVMENHGNISKSMREAGYSEVTAKNPKNLTKSPVWEEMINEYLPDELLLKVQVEGLGATVIKTSFSEPDKEVKDFPTRHRYLETALKIKGHLKEKIEHGGNITLNTLIQVNENHQSITVADSSPKGQNEVQSN